MDIRVLRYFLAVAHEKNITRAAESLHIAQPSLSKQLIDLEKELGKTLLVRGKRQITLTDDGLLLRKRAEEIVGLLEKTQLELSADDSRLSGKISIGGNPSDSVLKKATALRSQYPDISFDFYSSDAIDVLERLDHGTLDFAVSLEPIDTMKYEYISLPDASRWGVLLPTAHTSAAKPYIEKQDLTRFPLIFHRRAGLQRLISRWAEADISKLNIAATYNVINGSPARFVKSGLGYFLTTEDLLSSAFDEELCFRPLEPPLEIHYALIWKRYASFSKAAEKFLEQFY